MFGHFGVFDDDHLILGILCEDAYFFEGMTSGRGFDGDVIMTAVVETNEFGIERVCEGVVDDCEVEEANALLLPL